MPRSETVVIRVTPEIRGWLEETSTEYRTTMSALARFCMTHGMEKAMRELKAGRGRELPPPLPSRAREYEAEQSDAEGDPTGDYRELRRETEHQRARAERAEKDGAHVAEKLEEMGYRYAEQKVRADRAAIEGTDPAT